VTIYYADGILDYTQRVEDRLLFKYKYARIAFTDIEAITHLGKYSGNISFDIPGNGGAFIQIRASQDLVKFITSFNDLPSYKDDMGLRIALSMNLELSKHSALGIRDLLTEWINKSHHPDNSIIIGNTSISKKSFLIKSLNRLAIGSHKNDVIEQIKTSLQSREYIEDSDIDSLEKLLASQLDKLNWANN
jgi:hypothetical protein